MKMMANVGRSEKQLPALGEAREIEL